MGSLSLEGADRTGTETTTRVYGTYPEEIERERIRFWEIRGSTMERPWAARIGGGPTGQ